jgi:urease accessory protein
VTITAAIQAEEQKWRLEGHLSLEFDLNASLGQTSLRVCKQTPPLKVIRAFDNGGGGVLVHLHNVSGGILAGDYLELVVTLGANSYAQLTTTGATRLYQHHGNRPCATQINQIVVGENALLEMLPDQMIPFAGAAYRQDTHIKLGPGAGLFWWETLAPGRVAAGELFEYDLLDLRFALFDGLRPIALEHSRLEPGVQPMCSPVRLGSYRYISTFYICRVGVPPATWLTLETELRDLARQLSSKDRSMWGVSTLVASGLVVRGLTQNGPDASAGLLAFWQDAKQALYQKPANPPRKVY